MRRLAWRIALAGTALLPAPRFAQAEAPALDSTIVVTGEQPTRSEVTRQARAGR
jgi:hypothetical protein